jgi:serine/threonine protein kinase/tetratricopeptide (TPR) repeat protein
MSDSSCPSDEQLTELVEGGLSDVERASIERHAADCGACRAMVAALARSIDAHDSIHGERSELALQPIAEDAYEVGREIARGGMGRILEAWDRRHHRRVAVKVLLHKAATSAHRFVREIRITARLQHPAIIPLYEAGIWPDGEPFFAMKLVSGRSLARVVESEPTLAGRLALLPNVIAITDALAYAHGQGIVHRDLKPTNVLIGEFGETVVIDWGLAKARGADEPAADASDDHATDAALTMAGKALGTPSYMPPEQAAGDAVDERADVYALGAMVYHVLAGAAPFSGGSSDELLARVLAGPPPSLAERVPGVAPDLVTIVEKAMSRWPADRYPTAKAMADDLKRWADGRRVSTHHYSIPALLKRWVASHRATVAMATLLVVALSVGGAVSVRRIVRERDRADELKVKAEAKERAAVTRRDAAENLTDYLVVDLRAKLATVGRLDLLAAVGGEVERYYQSVSGVDDIETAATLAHRAAAFDVMSDVEGEKNDRVAARERAARAVALRERALELAPSDRESRAHLVESLVRLSAAEAELTHRAPALEAARRAAEFAGALLREDPSSRRFELLVADAQTTLAARLETEDDAREELESRKQVRDVLARMSAANREDIDVARRLGEAYGAVGYVQQRIGAEADTEASYAAALATFDELTRKLPKDAPLKLLRANALRWNGNARYVAGDIGPAFEFYQRCVAAIDELVARDAENDEWKQKLVKCLAGISATGVPLGRLREARAAQTRATALDEAVFARHPEGETAPRMVALDYHDMARIALAEKNAAEALAHIRHSLSLMDALVARDPARPLWRRARADMVATSARVYLALGQKDAARDAAREAESTLASLLAAAPTNDGLTSFLASVRTLLGRVLVARGESAAAIESLERALEGFATVESRQGTIDAEWVPDFVEAARILARLDAKRARERLAVAVASLERMDGKGRLRGANRAILASLRADLAAAR